MKIYYSPVNNNVTINGTQRLVTTHYALHIVGARGSHYVHKFPFATRADAARQRTKILTKLSLGRRLNRECWDEVSQPQPQPQVEQAQPQVEQAQPQPTIEVTEEVATFHVEHVGPRRFAILDQYGNIYDTRGTRRAADTVCAEMNAA